MNNIFANATRNVRTNSCIKKTLTDLDKKSDAVGVSEAFREKKFREDWNAITESAVAKMNTEERGQRMEAVVMNSLTEGKIMKASNRILEECQTELFKNILAEYFVSSLWLDNDFVTENAETLYGMVSRFVDENGRFGILKEAMEKNPDSVVLKKIYEACDKTAKKVTKRKITEMKDAKDADNADAELTEDEYENFFDTKETLDIERIGELVKDKVLTVIQDEKERQAKEDEIVTEIEDELKKDEDVKDDKTIKEALNNIIVNKSPFEEATLFNALLRNSYSEIMAENVAIQSDVQNQYDEKHDSTKYDTDQTIDELDDDSSLDNFNEEHDQDSVTTDNGDEEINGDLAMEGATVNMDNVFADAIANYTLMETLYTLKLKDYSHESIKSITQMIVNPVSEAADSDGDSDNFVKVRADFFNIFNKFKDLKDVEKTKEDLKKFVDSCNEDEESAHNCEIQIATGIAQIKDIIEKNPGLKDKYQEIIDWCNDELVK